LVEQIDKEEKKYKTEQTSKPIVFFPKQENTLSYSDKPSSV
jgi:hypothetical protein